MIIDVTEIEGDPRHFDFTTGPDDLVLDQPGFRLMSGVRTEGDVARRAAQVEVKGTIATEAEVDCTRCLKPVPHAVAVSFDVSFVEPDHFAPVSDHELQADDLGSDVLDGGRVDLKEITREQILLNVPAQVFCRPDCKGLCAKCGSDRNLIDCKCDETEIDPRWAALKGLKGSK